MKRKSLTVHYRRLDKEFYPFNELMPFQKVISDAMSTNIDGTKISDLWSLRTYNKLGADNDTIFINVYSEEENNTFRDLVLYSQGHLQALLEEQAQANILSIK